MSGPCRVGLDALFLDPGVSGGSETYLRSLVPALVESFPDTRFELATTRRGAQALKGDGWGEWITVLQMPCDDDRPLRRTACEQVGLPRLARSRCWDVLHTLANRGPRFPGVVSAVTVHDVIFFDHRTMSPLSTHGMRWALKAAVAGADGVIAISEAAAGGIAGTLGVDRARIVAIPHGPGRRPAAEAPAAEVRRELGLEGVRVALCVAALRAHKNQGLLVRALSHLPPDVHVVLAGRDDGYLDEIRAEAARRGVEERLHVVNYVPDDELEALWQIADCAAFPTLAEGFGLPVLEAMRRGVPVACSNLPVLREVGADAARFFDQTDPESAATAVRLAMGDGDLAKRGRERAAVFTWERAAVDTFDFYSRILASSRRG